MNVQDLINWCNANGVGLDTQIAVSAQDDFLLTEGNVRVSNSPYFGNCPEGENYLSEHAPKDADGDIDYENLPQFLMLGTGY